MATQAEAEILANAARTAQMWTGDWGIYMQEVSRLTGLTIEQCLLFDLVLTHRDVCKITADNVAWVRAHIEAEHRGDRDDWQTPKDDA